MRKWIRCFESTGETNLGERSEQEKEKLQDKTEQDKMNHHELEILLLIHKNWVDPGF